MLKSAEKFEAPLEERLALYKNTLKPLINKAVSETKESIASSK
jgi:hypothetical protein